MKMIKYLFAGIVVFLLVFLPFSFDFYGASDELGLLLISFGLMVMLSVLNYKESIEKMKNIAILNIRFTRGLAYCLCSLPFLYKLMEKPKDHPFLGWQIMLYFLFLIFAIFNYGIELKLTRVQNN
jgi:hypothetical protein